MEPLPGVFDMLQYFETILPLVESLCIFTQNWLDHLLLITLYLVTIATDHH